MILEIIFSFYLCRSLQNDFVVESEIAAFFKEPKAKKQDNCLIINLLFQKIKNGDASFEGSRPLFILKNYSAVFFIFPKIE